MFNDLPLGKKIGFGFTTIIFLIVVVGGAGYYSLENAAKATSFYHHINEIERLFGKAKEQIAIYLMNSYADGKAVQHDAYLKAVKTLSECRDLIAARDDKSGELFSDETDSRSMDNINGNISRYIENYKKVDQSVQIKMQLASDVSAKKEMLKKILKSGLFMGDEMLASSRVFFAESDSYIQRSTESGYEVVAREAENQNRAVADWIKKIESSEELNAIGREITAQSDLLKKMLRQYHEEEIESNSLLQQMEKQQSDLYKDLSALAALTLDRIRRVEKAAKTTIVVFIAISLVMALLLSFFIARAIVKPVLKISQGLKDIAHGEGDLTMRINIKSRDEVGELAGWFNQFIQRLQEMIRDIAVDASVLKQSSTEISSLSHNMSQESNEISRELKVVAESTDEMIVNMKSMEAVSQKASNNILIIRSSTEEMRSAIGEIDSHAHTALEITSEAVDVSNSTSENIDRMSNIVNEISKVTEVITEISEQTNLLALNATIEAARAGQAGKGFAVVANEIKELAKHTAGATLQIKDQIGSVQISTEQMVGNIDRVTRVINDIDKIVSAIADAAEKQSSITAAIAENMNQTYQDIADVSENVSQSSAVASDIAKDIGIVNSLGSDIAGISITMNDNAVEFCKLAQRLQEMVNRFRI